jgi:hypothetical protein
MDLSYAEVGYFITQVALSAASFGVAQSDLQIVGTALGSLFDVRCAPPTIVIPAQGAQLQSICTDASTCPLAMNASCALYETNITEPASATTSSMMSTGTATTTASSSSMPATASTAAGAAGAYPAGIAVFGALLAFLL